MSAKRHEAAMRKGWGPRPAKRGIVAQARAKKRKRNVLAEIAEKRKVIERDRRCRFPLCGCQGMIHISKRMLTVSHDFHKGMGGDPQGKVTIADLMLALCKWRHQDAPVSRDKKTLRTVYLTPDNSAGPLAFEIDLSALYPDRVKRAEWFEVARESYGDDGRIVLDDVTPEQRRVLEDLATMER